VHELAVCQGLISQLEKIAREQGASSVLHIVLSVGALSGVEAPLLDRAFEIARMGTVAEEAKLEIQAGPVVVQCRICGNRNEARANRLLCDACGDWQVDVKQGDEMLLLRVELAGLQSLKEAGARESKRKEMKHGETKPRETKPRETKHRETKPRETKHRETDYYV
jgi:hydrogenase nickel incorporation protein HypA/HybF